MTKTKSSKSVKKSKNGAGRQIRKSHKPGRKSVKNTDEYDPQKEFERDLAKRAKQLDQDIIYDEYVRITEEWEYHFEQVARLGVLRGVYEKVLPTKVIERIIKERAEEAGEE